VETAAGVDGIHGRRLLADLLSMDIFTAGVLDPIPVHAV